LNFGLTVAQNIQIPWELVCRVNAQVIGSIQGIKA
jgi:hypothetical protein